MPNIAKIFRQDLTGGRTLIGTGTAKFKVEKDKPNTIFVEAEGFAPLTETYVRGQKYPKIVEAQMKDRLVKLSAMPYDAQIYANGQANWPADGRCHLRSVPAKRLTRHGS